VPMLAIKNGVFWDISWALNNETMKLLPSYDGHLFFVCLKMSKLKKAAVRHISWIPEYL